MSQSRSIRFVQVRLVTTDNIRVDPMRDHGRVLMPRAKVRSWPSPVATVNAITVPETVEPQDFKKPVDAMAVYETSEHQDFKESLDQEIAALLREAEQSRSEETGAVYDDAVQLPQPNKRDHSRPALQPPSTRTPDEADQKVSAISTMSLVRSIVADKTVRAIADSVARISNDEANDRTGPWHFEMQHATHMLPMTILSIELSPGEILLRFVSGDAASVRLISDRKEDLRSQLLSRLNPRRSVHIEVVLE